MANKRKRGGCVTPYEVDKSGEPVKGLPPKPKPKPKSKPTKLGRR